MKYAEAQRWVRRFLRDPDGNIWSDDLIKRTWNHAQEELCATIGILTEVRGLPVPPRADWSFCYEWETAHLPSGETKMQALRGQSGYFAFCGFFEVHSMFVSNSSASPSDSGYATTANWESWYATPAEPPLWQLPDDWHSMQACYYDERPIFGTTRKDVQRSDRTYKQRQGEAQAWYLHDDVTRQISVYPRPSTAVWVDEEGEGMVTATSGDTESGEIGAVTRITGHYTSADSGVTVDVIEATDQLMLIYAVMPREIEAESDDLAWPDHIVKYINFRVLERLYGANTDGRIPSLSKFWGERYSLGVSALKNYVASRRRDRVHTMSTHKASKGSRKRHPRLPDTYPRTYP
jgi:hypothetical protein